MKKTVTIFMATAILVSCADLLNVSPQDQIASANMWTTEALADAGVAGLYYNFQKLTKNRFQLRSGDGHYGYDRLTFMGMEFQSNYYCTDPGLPVLEGATKSPSNWSLVHEWQWAYTSVHQVNDALQNLGNAPLSTEKYERLMCEVKFLRAFMYTRLNKVFQGVPLYLEVVTNDECTKGQSTSAEIWEAVINDLTDCIECENFPNNTLDASLYGRPSKGAAYSLRGQAYMYLAWENGEDNSYYQLAANDFEKVSECGYGLFNGLFSDFFTEANEKDHEMIFPLQYDDDNATCDNLQNMLAGTDNYGGATAARPSFNFVRYFKNEDGSDFNFADVIPEWYDDVFESDPAKREVFFFRDGIYVDDSGTIDMDRSYKIYNVGTPASPVKGQEALTYDNKGVLEDEIKNVIGADTFNKYYIVDGNEARCRSIFDNRDPRLKQFVITPYEPFDTYRDAAYNDGYEMEQMELRYPAIDVRTSHSYGDFSQYNEYKSYPYRKFVFFRKNELPNGCNHCVVDWPLIRYTDMYLYLAECYVHLGRLSEAVSIINEVRARSGWDCPVSVGSYDEVMEAVRYERRVELCAEGTDYFDEWRWGTYKEMKFQGRDVYGSQTAWGAWEGYDDTWYYYDYMYPWAAPRSECERNPNLKKAEGWAY